MSRNSQLGRALTVQTIHALYEHLQKSYLYFNFNNFPIFIHLMLQTSKTGYMQFWCRKIKATLYTIQKSAKLQAVSKYSGDATTSIQQMQPNWFQVCIIFRID
jgi:hypothetical protein